MVAVGFKAKSSALFLVLLLSLFNVVVNNWWSVHAAHPQRDFLKYESVGFSRAADADLGSFYQTLSVIGGFLMLIDIGAGGLSLDAKKRS